MFSNFNHEDNRYRKLFSSVKKRKIIYLWQFIDSTIGCSYSRLKWLIKKKKSGIVNK